jgi:hypothetical protein
MDEGQRADLETTAMKAAPEYILARRVLLDALQSLGAQRDAVVLVGAQAIYLHVGEGDLAIPVMTTDGDLAVDPARLHDMPLLAEAMALAGFVPSRPGSWRGEGDVEIDLMVPAAVAGRPGRRGADLGLHGTSVARQAKGLEPALVDHAVRPVASLDPADPRAYDVAVAGPAALLVAKLHKIAERVGTKRTEDKDALDILRLLRGVDAKLLATNLVALEGDPRSAAITTEAVGYLSTLFANETSQGSEMAGRAAFPAESSDVIAQSAAILAARLLRALRP